MNSKIIIGVIVLALVLVGWFSFKNNTVDYVATVNDEISALEGELAEIEAAVETGTLTPEEAVKAQEKIVARLDTINNSVTSSQNAKLTDAQKAQLNDGLERLKNILVEYQATLMVVDAQVETLQEVEKSKLRSGGSHKKVSEIVVETVTEMEGVIEEIVEDYEETPLEELFEENASSSEEISEEWLEDLATSTKDASGLEETGEESTTPDEGQTVDEETSDDTQSEPEATVGDQENATDNPEEETATSS